MRLQEGGGGGADGGGDDPIAIGGPPAKPFPIYKCGNRVDMCCQVPWGFGPPRTFVFPTYTMEKRVWHETVTCWCEAKPSFCTAFAYKQTVRIEGGEVVHTGPLLTKYIKRGKCVRRVEGKECAEETGGGGGGGGNGAEDKCGPDVTTALSAVVRSIRRTFREDWDDSKRVDACVELLSNPKDGWDITQLHTNPEALEQTGCWVPDRCRMTVQVREGCHSIDAANYVAFGVMWSLCHDHFEQYRHMPGDNPYTYTAMVVLVAGWGVLAKIVGHKVEEIMGYKGPRGGVIHRVKWAITGWAGWPGSPTPQGDISGCSLRCGPYKGPSFDFTWRPHKT